MATGKTFVPITPGRIVAGMPELVEIKEASEQTFDRGAPLVRTGGYAVEMGVNGVLLYGFAAEDGRSGAADGTYSVGVYPARFGRTFVGSLDATLTQAMVGSVANLVESASTWYINTADSLSSVAQVVIEGPAEGFAVGDVDPLIYFTVKQAMIEES